MRMNCTRCERPTYWPSRAGKESIRIRPASLPAGIIMAVTSDGTCNACWRIIKGKTRLTSKGTIDNREVVYRHTLTDAEIEQAREALLKLWASRRRRGIDPEGQDPAVLQRPGLSLMEV